MRRRRAAQAVLLCAALPALLLGCGRAPSDRAKGVYRAPLTENPESLDPARYTTVSAEGVARRLFNGLVTLDAALQPVPDLAERWTVSEDGQTYTFHLRPGVRFHNGRPLTSRDVRYSFERLLRKDTASQRAFVVLPIAGAQDLRDGKADTLSGLVTPDDATVVITLAAPFAPFLSHLAMGNAAIVPREEVEKPGDPFGRRPVGTGPFRFVRWADNSVIELEANPDYYAGPPRLTGLRFRIIKEPLVAYQEYLAGGLEHCSVPEGYLDAVKQGPLAAELRTVNTLSTYFLGVMMTRKPCGENVHLRRAMNYAVDRAYVCATVLGGAHAPAAGILPPGMPGHDPARTGYTHDPARAREELRLAGYTAENPPPEVALFVRGSPPAPQVAQAVQNDLKRVGISVKLRTLDFGALTAAVNRQEPDLFFLSWMADFPDPDNFLQLFHSSRCGDAGNRARFSDPETDRLLERFQRETDPAARQALCRDIESRLLDAAPWIVLSHKQTQLLVKPYVRHFTLTPLDLGTSVNRVDMHKVSLDSGPQAASFGDASVATR